jgi:hypothetical protein
MAPDPSKTPNPPVTPPEGSGTTPPNPDYGKLAESISTLSRAVEQGIGAGKPREEAVEEVAQRSGIPAETLEKFFAEADEKGELGKAIVSFASTQTAALRQEMAERDGRRNFETLDRHKDFSEVLAETGGEKRTVFDEYGGKFENWMAKNRYSYAGLASGQKAAEMFRYFLVNETDYLTKRDEAKEKRRTAPPAESAGGGRRTPSSPSLRPGAQPEGGVGPRLVSGMLGGDLGEVEASPEQNALMDAFGFDEERKKSAMASQAKKTRLGTPLDFVTVKNEGGV